MSSSSRFQTKILRRTTAPEEYRVYRAGLEWDLADPIVIEKREDLKSKHRWCGIEPYHHQVMNLITFCRRLPVTLLADDVGLGKTISAGLIISELISRSRLTKVLIVCPKLLCPQWKEELESKFQLSSSIAIGRELIDADSGDPGAVITTYASARLHLDSIPSDRFQMLVLDEAHKLRNLYGTEEPPQVAKRFRKALEDRRFRFVLMLTATPIQNRLWDLYSLVDLLTAARGHSNPFGSEGMFARKFIADGREQARQLRPEARDEFRSIVYSYMSRVRRDDARLYFPERVVQLHKVDPTPAEYKLIDAIAKPIQNLNRLAQISILQALTSSPHALMAQLNSMARNRTVPEGLAASVRAIVTAMPTSAKLQGLGGLIESLKRENPERWRLVVFTGRLETQTTIQSFLESHGLKVGIINGMSGQRNQETIARFRQTPPDCHVIVSTEAGSEGVNLQVANVLVNYDLPWNPMIVEQRIGRVQRLASEHKSVSIFNIMLRGTFEEYIVGRLMEKLQMASHAIGDVEALLEASGIDGGDENGAKGFDERIRQLVLAALAGKDVEAATSQAEQSIAAAKAALEREEESINTMLGGMEGVEYTGPRAPSLPGMVRSMEPNNFTLAALQVLGARVTPLPSDLYLVEEHGGREIIRFRDDVEANPRSTLCAPGTAAFLRLIDRVIATGIHGVEDLDDDAGKEGEDLISQWVLSFGGVPKAVTVEEVHRCFEGTAVVRVRATVVHDSYERLVEIACSPSMHYVHTDRSGLSALPHVIENPGAIGVNIERLEEAANLDQAISEFTRFYLERRAQEMKSAGGDERKRRKLEDEFTPRLEMTLVALDGRLHRRIGMKVRYGLDAGAEYQNTLTITPHKSELANAPAMVRCSQSGRAAPATCLEKCQISGALVLRHLLVQSEITSRHALPEFTVLCTLSGKRVLQDEAQLSSASGNLVASSLLKSSGVSGRKAEPKFFDRCAFTDAEALVSELAVSEISARRYRVDEQQRSAVSGKAGHRSEFIACYETHQPVAIEEAERCEVTGNMVRPGVLVSCGATQKRVLPAELCQCAVTGKRVLKGLLVASSLSGALMIEQAAFRSQTGKFCIPAEAKRCLWSGRSVHPDDLRTCGLTGLSIHIEFVTDNDVPRLQPLVDLLNGLKRTEDEPQLWDTVTAKTSTALGSGRCRVEAAILSPDRRHLAVCTEIRKLLGFRVHQAGLVFAVADGSIVGRVVQGRRTRNGWSGSTSP